MALKRNKNRHAGRFWSKFYEPNSCRNLLKFKNIHKGQDCILMGSSPILKDIPHSFLKKFKVIGVNATPFHYVPDYLVSLDLRCSWVPEIRRLARDTNTPYFMKWHVPPEDASLYTEKDLIYFPNEIHMNGKVITSDEDVREDILAKLNTPEVLETPTGGHKGVVQDMALPLAFYMGFERVFLVGIEFPHSFTEDNLRFYKEDKYGTDSNAFNDRRWSIELISETNKKNRVFTLNKECTLKSTPFVDYRTLI